MALLLLTQSTSGATAFATTWPANQANMKVRLYGYALLLFVEMLFAIRTITFRGTSVFKMQNEHPLTHIFSLQQRASFSHEEKRTNGHFHGDHEKLFVRK